VQNRRQKLLNWAEIIFVAVAIAVRVYFIYLPFKVFDYLVVPGDDGVNHFRMINEVLSGNYNFVYPKLFHIFIAKFSLITGMGVMDSLKAVTPFLMVLPSIAIYIFARKQFGRLAGIISFTIMLWGGTSYGLVAFGDGNYPNIIAAGFFMPLALLYMLESLKKGRLYNYLLAALFFGLTVLTHHLTTAMTLVIVVSYLVTLGVWNKFEKVAPNFKKVALFIFILIALTVVAISSTSLRTMFVSAWQSISTNGSVLTVKSFAKLLPYDDHAAQIGGLTWFGGLLSLFFLIYIMGKKEEGKHRAAYLLVFVWVAVIFVLSRIEDISLPARFARELAFPLVLSLGVMITVILNRLPKYSRIFAAGLFGFIIFTNLTQVNSGAYRAPEFFNKMVWFSQKDKEEADYLRTSTDPADKIVANPTTPYLPVFAQRNIEFLSPVYLTGQKTIKAYLSQTNPKYIFVGSKTAANPDGASYSFFADFTQLSDALTQYAKDQKLTIAKEFTDGSVLYVFEPVKKVPKSPN